MTWEDTLAFDIILRQIRSIVWYLLLSTGNCLLMSSELNGEGDIK